MKPLSFLLALVFFGSKGFFWNRLTELVPPLVASVMAKFEQTLWERFGNILKQSERPNYSLALFSISYARAQL